MRSLKATYTIPAHKSTVSDVRFFRHEKSKKPLPNLLETEGKTDDSEANADHKFTEGMYLASSGYDGMVKVWSADDWQLAKTLSTDAGKVMSLDLSPGGAYLASGSWNRSIQLYARE